MSNILISASILSADFARLETEIHQAEEAGIDWIHIDVMDGHFVPNISMGPFIVETCKRITELPLDVHLMISQPERHIEPFINAGADKLSIHIEENPNVHRTLQHIRSKDCHPGIVINPGTPVSHIESVLEIVDMVLVMSVNPGYSGQKFIPGVLKKISGIREMSNNQCVQPFIQIDGGITKETLPGAHQAGVNVFVSATAIFKHPKGIKEAVKELRLAAG